MSETRSEDDNHQLLKSKEKVKDAYALAVLMEWDEFKKVDWQRIYENLKNLYLFLMENSLSY